MRGKSNKRGQKRLYINVHRKYPGIKIRNFFGNGLKDKYNNKNSVGEESIVWKYIIHIDYRLFLNVKLVV